MIDPRAPDYTLTPVASGRPLRTYCPLDSARPPEVTIITPFFNTGAVFHETAQSVFQQTFQQWEWLIVNDCSNDPESLATLDSYRASDPRIRVIDHDHNRGPSAARNTGYAAASTSWLVKLDSDDLLEPTAIEVWLWYLISHPEAAFVKGYTVGFGAETYLWDYHGFHRAAAFLERNWIEPTCMVRAETFARTGGYDETMRHGLEDWDFWLRCANAGMWGSTVPLYLNWYRRRPSHAERWSDWNEKGEAKIRAEAQRRYPKLWTEGMPQIETDVHQPYERVADTLPVYNLLTKTRRRLIFVIPWTQIGDADLFNLNLIVGLHERDWDVTVVTTNTGDHTWLPEFTRLTSDVLVMSAFLRPVDQPRFLRYVIESRQADAVLISHSELGYHLLPYLRAYFPKLPILDYVHIEEPYWNSGGYPQLALIYQYLLDGTITSSQHLRQWLVQRGYPEQQAEVCYINVATEQSRPDPRLRARVRARYHIPNDATLILFAGRLVAQKQPEVLVETLRLLAEQKIPFHALIVGDGDHAPQVKAATHRHHLKQQVQMLGAQSNETVRDLMVASDIFFLPSLHEGIALSIYEAMACGVVPVGADVGGQVELVTTECGILHRRSSPAEEAATYARSLAALCINTELRQRMGLAARTRVGTQFRLAAMQDGMDGLLRAVRSSDRSVPNIAAGLIAAQGAVDQLARAAQASQMWGELLIARGEARPHAHKESSVKTALRRARNRLRPVYAWGVSHGMTWLVPLKERIRRSLL